jgi:alkylated DNA repair dioxygenase AlkB
MNINDIAARDDDITPIPRFISDTLLTKDEQKQYTQCIINLYEAENEIPWHVDHEYFGEMILVYVFGDNRPLLFRKQKTSNDEYICRDLRTARTDDSAAHHFDSEDSSFVYMTAYPLHCSKYILRDSARTMWEHSIPKGKAERISITFRSWRGPNNTSCSKMA